MYKANYCLWYLTKNGDESTTFKVNFMTNNENMAMGDIPAAFKQLIQESTFDGEISLQVDDYANDEETGICDGYFVLTLTVTPKSGVDCQTFLMILDRIVQHYRIKRKKYKEGVRMFIASLETTLHG